ncbi:MAG: putative transposase [Phycisphaerales bacterium]|jgi:putative transposase
MPNHVHLLIWPREEVPPILKSIKLSVSKRAVTWTKANAPEFLPQMLDLQPNGKQSNRFWQRGGGYGRNLWEPEKIWKAIDYIHMNPVKAGLCDGPYDWAWSSAKFFTPERSGPLKIDLETIPGRPV